MPFIYIKKFDDRIAICRALFDAAAKTEEGLTAKKIGKQMGADIDGLWSPLEDLQIQEALRLATTRRDGNLKQIGYLTVNLKFDRSGVDVTEFEKNYGVSALTILKTAGLECSETIMSSSSSTTDKLDTKTVASKTMPLTQQTLPTDENAIVEGAKHNQYSLVEYLLKQKKADVNAIDAEASSALMHASFLGNLEMVRLLIENGAKFDMENNLKDTALLMALYKGHLEVAQFLIEECHIDVNQRISSQSLYGTKDSTILFTAVSSKNLALVRWLVEEKKADVNVMDHVGHTPLIYAVLTDDIGMVKYFLEKINNSSARAEALACALRYNKNQISEYLLSIKEPEVSQLLSAVGSFPVPRSESASSPAPVTSATTTVSASQMEI